MNDFNEFKKKIEEIKNFLKKEFSGIRTGSASIAILDPIKVEVYGTQMPINQLAHITTENATSILITPFDTNISNEIEKAIKQSGTGLAISNSGTSIRVSFPALTTERRKTLIKLAKEKLENARVSLRKERDNIKNNLIKLEKSGEISKDEKFKLNEEMEKITKEANQQFDEIYKIKKEEIEK